MDFARNPKGYVIMLSSKDNSALGRFSFDSTGCENVHTMCYSVSQFSYRCAVHETLTEKKKLNSSIKIE